MAGLMGRHGDREDGLAVVDVGRKAQGLGEGVVVVAQEAFMALDTHTLHPRALHDRLVGLGAVISGLHAYIRETTKRAVYLPLGPEAEERRWDGQNEVLQVGEHGVNRGGASGDRDNTIVLRLFDESQSSSDGSRWKSL
jgi:hypothetical protein